MTFIKRISVSKLLCDSSKEEGGGEAGNLYYVNWFNWKDDTGQTPHVCYSKKSSEGEYKVSRGTGP